MLGKLLKEYGAVYESSNALVVHKHLEKDGIIESHNHPGYMVFFTVVKGEVETYLNGEETYRAVPQTVFNFDGENFISAKGIEESDIFIYLIKK